VRDSPARRRPAAASCSRRAAVVEQRHEAGGEIVDVALAEELAAAVEHLGERAGVGGEHRRPGDHRLGGDAAELLLPGRVRDRGDEQHVIGADPPEGLVLRDGAREVDAVAEAQVAREPTQPRLLGPAADELEHGVLAAGAGEGRERELRALLGHEPADETDAHGAVHGSARRRRGNAERQHVHPTRKALPP